MKSKRIDALMYSYVNILTFQEGCAESIRITPGHDDHTSYFNERYWHGFAAALRYAREAFEARFTLSTKPREGGE